MSPWIGWNGRPKSIDLAKTPCHVAAISQAWPTSDLTRLYLFLRLIYMLISCISMLQGVSRTQIRLCLFITFHMKVHLLILSLGAVDETQSLKQCWKS